MIGAKGNTTKMGKCVDMDSVVSRTFMSGIQFFLSLFFAAKKSGQSVKNSNHVCIRDFI